MIDLANVPPTPRGTIQDLAGLGYLYFGSTFSNFTEPENGILITTRHHGEITVASVEHAYQAAKTDDAAHQLKVLEASTPAKAKRLGRALTLRNNWNAVRVPLMAKLVAARYKQDPELRELLHTTEYRLIAEDNPHDAFWGIRSPAGALTGCNWMGTIYMSIREVTR